MRCALITVVAVLLGSNEVLTKLPDYVEKCTAGEKKCILKNIGNVFATKFQGDKSFGLETLDPIALDPIDIKADPNTPVKINLSFINGKLIGCKDIKAAKIKGFGKSPAGHHDLLFEAPILTLDSDYKADGQILILPVVGEGKSKSSMINPKLKIGLDCAEKIKDGVVYMDVKNTTLDLEYDRINFYFGNLFNGDKALGDNFNEFINQNWREVFADIKKPFLSKLSQQMHRIIKGVFDETPYTDFFEVK